MTLDERSSALRRMSSDASRAVRSSRDGLLAEHVEQLLLVERLRRPQLLLEVVERVEQLLLALAHRRELLGDAAQERRAPRLSE